MWATSFDQFHLGSKHIATPDVVRGVVLSFKLLLKLISSEVEVIPAYAVLGVP